MVVSLLVLLVRVCRVGNKRRVTFQEDVEEREIVEIDSDNYGAAAAGNKISEGWCEEEIVGKEKQGEALGCSDSEMEKAEALMQTDTDEKGEFESEKLKVDLDLNNTMCKDDNERNFELEKEAMMAIKEQSVELARYKGAGAKQKSGMRKVLERFPFLKNFGSEHPNVSQESLMTEETSKPDIIGNGLPSYNEATHVEEKELEKLDELVTKDVPGEELLDESESVVPENEESPTASGIITEGIPENETQEAATANDAIKDIDPRRPKEKKFGFRFSLFSNEK